KPALPRNYCATTDFSRALTKKEKKSSSSNCLFRQTKRHRRQRLRRLPPLHLRGRNRAFGWAVVAAGRASARRRLVAGCLGRPAGFVVYARQTSITPRFTPRTTLASC